MSYTFWDNQFIQIAPYIPETITNMESTFDTCIYLYSLSEGFTIPAGVTNMIGTFCLCENLTGTIIINANPEKYEYCFTSCLRHIEITGDTTLKDELLATRD